MAFDTMELEALHHFLAAASFVLGTLIGSFLNVCVYRIPNGLSIIRPASRCPKCEAAIGWRDNIPILSWMVLGGKCRHCEAPISWQYPLVEAITGILVLLVYLHFGLTWATPVYMLFAASMVLVTFVDLTDWTIPDEVTLPGVPIGIACSTIGMFLPASGFQVEHLNETVFDSLLGVALGFLSLYLLDKISLLLLGKRGMGFGDVKLNAMLGAFLGWKGVLMVIMFSAFLGSIVGLAMIVIQRMQGKSEESHYLPFGPYLAGAGLIVLFLGSDLYAYYNELLMAGVVPADSAF